MKNLFIYGYYWFLDYVYVTKEQIASIFSRSSPDKYRTSGGSPVLLIPGVYENWRFMHSIALLLFNHGYDVHILDGLGYNRGSVEDMSTIVTSYIREHALSNVVLVTHSKGGLIGKLVLSTMAEKGFVKGLVAINAPFSGSKYAYVLPLRSLRIFIPNSKILVSLAQDTLINKFIVSIYGKFDPHIPNGSKLDGAKNIQLDTYGHFRVLNDPYVCKAVLESIRTFS